MRIRRRCWMLGCDRRVERDGLCTPHSQRREQYGDPAAGPPVRVFGVGSLNKSNGYYRLMRDRVTKSVHVWIAEAALGRALPLKAVVHHADGDRANNAPGNLVVCPDSGYHKLLHQRMDALAACGHADWRKCRFCRGFDAPANLFIDKTNVHHRACMTAYYRDRRNRDRSREADTCAWP